MIKFVLVPIKNRLLGVWKRHPMIIGCTNSSLLVGTGEILVQVLIEKREFPVFELKKQFFGLFGLVPLSDKKKDIHQKARINWFPSSKYKERKLKKKAEKRTLPFPEPVKPFDYIRLGKKMTMAFCVMAPNLFFWYSKGIPRILSLKMLSRFSETKKKVVVTIMDQTLFTTYWSSVFLFASGISATYSPYSAVVNVKENILSKVKQGWLLWPFLIFLNISYVHPMMRTFYVNFCMIWWNVHLANKKESKKAKNLTEAD